MSSFKLADIYSMPDPGYKPKLPTVATLAEYFTVKKSTENNDNKDNKEREKTQQMVCRYFRTSGGCDKGSRCGYLHDNSDAKTKYKTQICTRYEAGHCRYGEECSYAHGEKDLRKN